jgi:hypothetical protein
MSKSEAFLKSIEDLSYGFLIDHNVLDDTEAIEFNLFEKYTDDDYQRALIQAFLLIRLYRRYFRDFYYSNPPYIPQSSVYLWIPEFEDIPF